MGSTGTSGLFGGANTGGLNIAVPYAPQGGGQAALGGAINPLLPVSATSTASPVLPSGAVSTSSSTGLPASTGGFPAYGFPGGSTTGTPAGGVVPSAPNLGTTGTGSNPGNTSSSLSHNLSKTFGAGLGSLIQNFLTSGAGYNPAVLQQLFAQLQPQFNQQQQDLLQQFSASGNRFGSGAQTGFANLLGQQSQTEGSVAANLYESSISNFMNLLENAGDTTAGRIQQTPTTLDNIGQVAQIGTSIAGAALA